MSRIRSRGEAVKNGTWSRFGAVNGGNPVTTYTERCEDQPGPGDDGYLDVYRSSYSGGVLQTDPPPNYFSVYFDKYICEAIQYQGVFEKVSVFTGEKANEGYAADAAARTNPSSPYIDVPVNVLELGDIALLLKKTGDSLIAEAAGNNLKLQFGLLPILRDLSKISDFQAQFDKRASEMKKLRTKGLRKTVSLDKLTQDCSKTNVAFQSAGGFISGNLTGIAHREIRAHVRWIPSWNYDSLSDREMSALIRRSLLGMTIDPSTLWEAMPWSWLIDWGFGVGAYFRATRNIVPAVLDHVAVMKHTRIEYTSPKIRQGATEMSPIKVTHEGKSRIRAAVLPTAYLPFLTANQMGILASLAIVKAK
jgi:hypothetical protein